MENCQDKQRQGNAENDDQMMERNPPIEKAAKARNLPHKCKLVWGMGN